MVLESEFIFHDEKVAQEFVSFIKEKGFFGRMRITSGSSEKSTIEGKIKNFLNLFDEEIKRLNRELHLMDDTRAVEEPELKTLDNVSTPEKDDSYLAKCKENLENFKAWRDIVSSFDKNISAIIEQTPIGGTPTCITEIQSMTEDIKVGREGTELIAENEHYSNIRGKVLDKITALMILNENNLLDMDNNTTILKDKIPSAECTIILPLEDMPMISIGLASSHSLSYKVRIEVFESYIVTTNSRIVFLDEIEDFDLFFKEHSCMNQQYHGVRKSILNNSVIVSNILSYINKSKKTSIDEIIHHFRCFNLEGAGENIVVECQVSPTVISCIIDDLKKINVIEGKDTKIRRTK